MDLQLCQIRDKGPSPLKELQVALLCIKNYYGKVASKLTAQKFIGSSLLSLTSSTSRQCLCALVLNTVLTQQLHHS